MVEWSNFLELSRDHAAATVWSTPRTAHPPCAPRHLSLTEGHLRMRAPVRATAGVLLALAVTAIGTSASAAPATSTTKVITYDGAKITVPTSWPVYDLSTHPTQCVRFDQHAVYLGHPGATQNCP